MESSPDLQKIGTRRALKWSLLWVLLSQSKFLSTFGGYSIFTLLKIYILNCFPLFCPPLDNREPVLDRVSDPGCPERWGSVSQRQTRSRCMIVRTTTKVCCFPHPLFCIAGYNDHQQSNQKINVLNLKLPLRDNCLLSNFSLVFALSGNPCSDSNGPGEFFVNKIFQKLICL